MAGPSPAWLRLSQLIETALHIGALAGAIVLVSVGAVIVLHRSQSGWRHSAARWWLSHRTVGIFVVAVSNGDLDTAEAAARRLFGDRDTAPRPRRSRVSSWDERLIVRRPWVEVNAELGGADGLAPWCRRVQRVSLDDRVVVSIGRRHPLQLQLLSRSTGPTTAVRFTSDPDGPTIEGHLVVRPSHRLPLNREQVEVWVHAEGPSCHRSRRALRIARRATRNGLRRWAAGRVQRSALSGRV